MMGPYHSDDSSSGHSSPSDSPSSLSSSYNEVTFPAPESTHDEPESPTSKHHRPSLLKTVIRRNSMKGLRTHSFKTEESESHEVTIPTKGKNGQAKEEEHGHSHGIHLPSIHLPHPHLRFSSHNSHSSHSSQSSNESLVETIPIELTPPPPLPRADISPSPKRRISLPAFHFRRKHAEEPMKTLSYMVPFSFAASAVGRVSTGVSSGPGEGEGKSPESDSRSDHSGPVDGPPGLAPAVPDDVLTPDAKTASGSTPTPVNPAPALPPLPPPATPIIPDIVTPPTLPPAPPTPPQIHNPSTPKPAAPTPPSDPPTPVPAPPNPLSKSVSPPSNRRRLGFWSSWQRMLGISHMSGSRLAFRALVLMMEIAYLRVGRWTDARKIGIVLMLELVDYGVAGVDQRRIGQSEDVFERMSGDGEYSEYE